MRLDKYLSNLKYGTRNDIKKMIRQKRIVVNQTLAKNSDDAINPISDIILVDGVNVVYFEVIHLALYKPKGYLSATKDAKHPCLMDLIKAPYDRYDLKMAGRLDLDAHGLVILTTDGQLAHEITHPKKHLIKTYEVVLDKSFKNENELLAGVIIKDGHHEDYLAKAITIKSNEKHVKIQIDEGRFHQVKRMFEHVGYEVIDLMRTQIGHLTLSDLKPGTYKTFNKETLYDRTDHQSI